MIFKTIIREGYVFKVLTEMLSHNFRTGCFELSPTGISLCTINNQNELLFLVNIHAKQLEDFTFNPQPDLKYYDKEQSKFFVGITMSHFYRMFSAIKKKDMIELFIDDKNPNILQSRFISDDLDNHTCIASVTIQSIRELTPEVSMDNISTHSVEVRTDKYQKMIKLMSKIHNTVKITSLQGQIIFSASQEGVGSRTDRYGIEDSSITEETNSADYSTELLLRLCKISGITNTMKIYTGSPMRIVAPIGMTRHIGTLEIHVKSKQDIEEEKCMIDDDYEVS
jgi:hypothetical protein